MSEYACDLEMAQNSYRLGFLKFLFEILITCFFLRWLTFFSSKILRWLKIRKEIEFEAKMIRILSLLKIFELKK